MEEVGVSAVDAHHTARLVKGKPHLHHGGRLNDHPSVHCACLRQREQSMNNAQEGWFDSKVTQNKGRCSMHDEGGVLRDNLSQGRCGCSRR